MTRCAARFAHLIDREFVRGLSARQRRALRDHLTACMSCRERWERLAAVDRGLGGPAMTPAMVDDIGAVVVGPPTRRPRWPIWVGAGTLAATAGVLALVLWSRPGDRATLTPRGGEGGLRTAGIRLFCITRDSDHVQSAISMVSRGPFPELRCTIDADLQLAYSTPNHEGLTMVVFGQLGDTTLTYAPAAGARDAMMLRADQIDQLTDWSTRLAVNHRPGRYDVVARFFDHDVAVDAAIEGRAAPVAELRAQLDIVSAGGNSDAP